MSRRDSLSRFVLPFVGAAVLTAGSLLLQMGRKPAPAPTSGPSQRSSGRTVPGGAASPNPVALGNATDDDTLLRRLREQGL